MSSVRMETDGTGDDEEQDEPLLPIKSETVSNGIVADDEVDEPLDSSAIAASAANTSRAANAAADDDDDDDEVDEPILPADAGSNIGSADSQVTGVVAASVRFNEAQVALSSDCWDVSSWMVYIEEAERQRSGSLTVSQAYKRVLDQFPRASKFWLNLAEYHLQHKQFTEAEEVFQQCLQKCRSVDLWATYLAYLRDQCADALKFGPHSEQYTSARERCSAAFEGAVENVGLAIDSYPIWRNYLDYISSWPETGAIDASKKLSMLRQVYQMAVCVAMLQGEDVWSAYEAFERSNSGAAAEETLLPEFNRKFLHAKSILRERRKLTNGIMFDRLSVPPTNSENELRQLELWNNWIIFEMTKPDHLNPESFRPMVQMIYDQCLSCFLYNPEIWLGLMQFELQQSEQQQLISKASAFASSTSEGEDPKAANEQQQEQQQRLQEQVYAPARAVLLAAIDSNPTVALLRTSLSELEECAGQLDAAKEVLRVSFEQLPSGFTFALYQRLVRRTVGMKAARQLFGETLPLRVSNDKLGLEIYLANAQLELEVNSEPAIALKVLNLAKANYPQSIKNIAYVKAAARVLMQMGDLMQLRNLFQTALSDSANMPRSSGGSSSSSSSLYTGGIRGGAQYRYGGRSQQQLSATAVLAAASSVDTLRSELDMWEEYLRAETMLGMSSIVRLNELRSSREKAKAAYEEAERIRLGIAFNSREDARAASIPGMFLPARLVSERCSIACPHISMMPELDEELNIRSCMVGCTPGERITAARAAKLGAVVTSESLAFSSSMSGGPRRDRELMNMSTDFHLSMVGLPAIVRDLLAKLPFHVGPPPDVDGFIRHMKSTVLPPRPAEEAPIGADGDDVAASASENNDDYANGSAKAASLLTSEPAWLSKATSGGDEDDEGDDAANHGSNGNAAIAATVSERASKRTRASQDSTASVADDDVFRKRQRTKAKK